MSIYSERIKRVQELLREEDAVAAVFAPTDQMRYLTGWAEPGHERLIALLVPAEGDPAFIVPSMNAAQAKQNPAAVSDVFGWGDADGWSKPAQRLLRRWKASRKNIYVDDDMASVHLLDFQKLSPRSKFKAAAPLMQKLREIKSADELDRLGRSAVLTDSVYEEACMYLKEGMTEEDLQDVIANAYKARGTRPAFSIICFGANSAMPHHHTGQTKLERGDVVIMDIGCVLDDYYSDITRTVSFGKPKPKTEEVYNTVYKAFRAAMDFGKPGVTGEEVDQAARKVIEDAGYGKYFIHRTGHGIGLSGHEPPNIVKGNNQPLKPGMCFSDEPGIYLPGKFGVRIENIVTVTESGLRSFNAEPPSSIRVIQ